MRLVIAVLVAGAGTASVPAFAQAAEDWIAAECGALSANAGAYRLCIERGRAERVRIARDGPVDVGDGHLYAGAVPRPVAAPVASVGRGSLVREFADDVGSRRKICEYRVAAGLFHLTIPDDRACPRAIN